MGSMKEITSMDLRDEIGKAVDAWATHAHRQTYLPERLHPKARGWLIDHLETMLRAAGVSTVGPVAGPKGEKPKPVVKAAPAAIPPTVPAPKAPEPPAAVTASNGASKGPAESAETPTMADLKAKVKGKQKGKQS
jgi:hypothetical protein